MSSDVTPPRLSVYEGVGGHWFVKIHGLDNCQDNRYAVMYAASGQTKEEALEGARKWFAEMIDDSPAQPTEEAK